MGVILKAYATMLIIGWFIGVACILCGKTKEKVFDVISTVVGILMGIGLIGLIVFVIWLLWNL